MKSFYNVKLYNTRKSFAVVGQRIFYINNFDLNECLQINLYKTKLPNLFVFKNLSSGFSILDRERIDLDYIIELVYNKGSNYLGIFGFRNNSINMLILDLTTSNSVKVVSSPIVLNCLDFNISRNTSYCFCPLDLNNFLLFTSHELFKISFITNRKETALKIKKLNKDNFNGKKINCLAYDNNKV